jgi:hypothetical protein
MARSTLWLVGFAVACGAPPNSARAPAPVASAPAAAYPAPQAVFPADRLDERVDGAAELLRKAGCRRLLYWRLEDPPADLELYVFTEAQAAKAALARDAGTDRSSASPGDEGWAGPQCLFFRRGANYVRLIADQAVTAEALTAQAQRLDRAVVRGEVRP